jgi:hypothetical protein
VTLSWGTNTAQWWAIIDTGADSTFIPMRFVAELRLKPLVEKVDVSGPDIVDEEIHRLYAVNLDFLGLTFKAHPVIPWAKWPEIIIGRDIINEWVLTLDGPNQNFTIT